MREPWTIDEYGRVRPATDPQTCRAVGWVDDAGGVGAIDRLDGEPAHAGRLPVEILDLLERRYPGTRWFVPARRAA